MAIFERILSIFKRRPEAPLEIGRRYHLRRAEYDPFKPDLNRVRVVDLREGWVKYEFPFGTTGECSEEAFRAIYEEWA